MVFIRREGLRVYRILTKKPESRPTLAIAAAEEMLTEGMGNKITWRAILARIGSGSSTTIMGSGEQRNGEPT